MNTCSLFLFLSNFSFVILEYLPNNAAFNKFLKNSGYKPIPGVSPATCLYECWIRKSRCKSVNYFRFPAGLCQLCEESSSSKPDWLEDRRGVLHASLTDYKQFPDTGCGSVICARTEKCVVRNNEAVCEKSECESLSNGLQRLGMTTTSIGTKVRIQCLPGRRVTTEDIIICDGNATWSETGSLCAPTTCDEVKRCKNNPTDGEYWLYPTNLHVNGGKVKVYCHGLQTGSPMEFISVDEETNYGYHEKSTNGMCFDSVYSWKISFSKIRIDITSLVVLDDHTYATQEGHGDGDINYLSNPFLYGQGSDCFYASCFNGQDRRGEFKINLDGTGLMLTETTEWELWGYEPVMSVFENDRRHVHGVCGGECGACLPKSLIQLQVDTDTELPINQAISLDVCDVN